MSRAKVGLQMYTLRDDTAKDFVGTLRKVAELGYEGVEFAGYGGLSAAQLRAELDSLGLVSLGAHISIDRMLSAADEEIEYNITLGSKYVAVPWLDESRYKDEASLREVCAQLEQIGRKCKERGLILCYHNHSFELEVKFGGRMMLDYIYDTVPADLLQVELDACWVHNAGVDPVAYIQQYSGRIPLVHFKDYKREGDHPETVELGTGTVDLPGIAKAAAAAGTEWLIVEQDVCKQNPPLVSVANSIEWMKQQGLR
ncbi:sugar phosphate isomerase/epimerase family protein [Paenibacillus thermotolerans]|uniref:sugar phosphate isomerase/epimerase family protein n=1 Tax=Paenibacillus thermotolerans TaxID=3027807 RepID=UPI002368063F|nr:MULTISPECIES: sugar phosphate isomerase/epimerase [unclassified Paenibacillus]